MKEIEIFSAIWDKQFNDIVSNIREAISEKNMKGKVNVRVFDVDDSRNMKSFKKYTIKMEKSVGIKENFVKAVPLVVIDGRPFSVGVGPGFKQKLIKRM